MEWISYSQVEKFLENTDIEISFDEDGLVGFKNNKKTHLDIYDMKGTSINWEKNPECKIDDVKNFLAVFFKDYEERYKELKELEID